MAKELAAILDPQTDIPRLAKDRSAMALVEHAIESIPTVHNLLIGDTREVDLEKESIHLAVTSPPYWTLKEFYRSDGQLGNVADCDQSLDELDKVWSRCFDALVPGGRLIPVVGDVCLSRRQNGGRLTVVPLHASIQQRCRDIGFHNLVPSPLQIFGLTPGAGWQ